MRGIVKMWKIGSGYGFLTSDNGQDKDIFVHCRDLINFEICLSPGDNVEFELEETTKGLRARQVRKIEQKVE
jgi:cold shock protein